MEGESRSPRDKARLDEADWENHRKLFVDFLTKNGKKGVPLRIQALRDRSAELESQERISLHEEGRSGLGDAGRYHAYSFADRLVEDKVRLAEIQERFKERSEDPKEGKRYKAAYFEADAVVRDYQRMFSPDGLGGQGVDPYMMLELNVKSVLHGDGQYGHINRTFLGRLRFKK